MNEAASTDQEMADALNEVEESFDDEDFEVPTVEDTEASDTEDMEEESPEETADDVTQTTPDFPEWDEMADTFADLSPEQQEAVKRRMKREVDRFHGTRGQELESLRQKIEEVSQQNQAPQEDPSAGVPEETWDALERGLLARQGGKLAKAVELLEKIEQYQAQMPQTRETQVKEYLNQVGQGQFKNVRQFKEDRPLIESLLESVGWDWTHEKVNGILNQRWQQYESATKRRTPRKNVGVESSSGARTSEPSGIPDMDSMEDILPFVAESMGE